MKKSLLTILALTLLLTFSGCSKPQPADDKTTYTIGICNYVDDASLNQIVANIRAQLQEIEKQHDVRINVLYDNCNLDANLLNQIIANFIDQKVDLMVAVATPVALAMQAATEDNNIPVIFAAVSDPLSCQLVDSLENPGHNISGTSDYLDTNAIMNLIVALKPQISKVGLLYDFSQDSSTTAIRQAKAYLDERNIPYIEKTGTNVNEIASAVQALILEGVQAVFTPSDNTVMTAELTIYEALAQAGIPHFAGADSFALNGAFLGYGVDYANLGVQTANMIAKVLIDKTDIAHLPVMTFDNGTATVNTEIAEVLNLNFEDLKALFSPLCSRVESITTAEQFGQ